MKKVVDPQYAKDASYTKVLKQIAEKGECPFCQEGLGPDHKYPLLKTIGNWSATRCSWPYKGSSYHFLIVSSEHFEDISELSREDFGDVFELANWLSKEFDIPGGALTFRFGDNIYTGSTVSHTHFHLIVPKVDSESNQADVVNFPIG